MTDTNQLPPLPTLRPGDSHMESLIDAAIQGHASTREAMRWLVRQLVPKPARAQVQGEPVAIYSGHRLTPEGTKEFWGYADKPLQPGTKLYTTPQPAQATQAEAKTDVRCEGCGYMTHHREHMGCVRAAKQFTHPAPGVPADVVLDAERYRWLRSLEHCNEAWCFIGSGNANSNLDAAIDAAMLTAAQAQKGQP